MEYTTMPPPPAMTWLGVVDTLGDDEARPVVALLVGTQPDGERWGAVSCNVLAVALDSDGAQTDDEGLPVGHEKHGEYIVARALAGDPETALRLANRSLSQWLRVYANTA